MVYTTTMPYLTLPCGARYGQDSACDIEPLSYVYERTVNVPAVDRGVKYAQQRHLAGFPAVRTQRTKCSFIPL